MAQRKNSWDEEVDLLVAGTGAAAMSAAIAGASQGLTVLVVESSDKWGGSTAMSGGGAWLPQHPQMAEHGIDDSDEKVLTYLDASVGTPEEVGPASSLARRKAFVKGAPEVYTFLEEQGMRWVLAKEYPDYYPDRPGGIAGGRTVEPASLNVRKMGDLYDNARETLPPVLPMRSGDMWLVSRSWSTFSGMLGGARLVFRTLGGLVTGRKLTGLGMSMAAWLRYIAVSKQGTEVRLNSPVTDLVVEDGAVVGAVVGGPEGETRIRAKAGVVFGAGGFESNKEMRQQYHGIDGNPSGADSNIGSAIQIGMEHGADVALMDDAWWGPSVAPTPETDPLFIVAERSMPFTICVDQTGKRFVNESTSYVDFGHAMQANGLDITNPAWMVMDKRHGQRYLNNATLMGGKKLAEHGVVVTADTLEELAEKTGMDKKVFKETIQRFNGFARAGVDEDFHRGETAYDNYYGDPTHKPNPNLGEIAKGPFTAFKIVLGDLGTKGGLLTDEFARVIDTEGNVIEGFYAAGNSSASVMGRTYPGAGSTLGPALVFGYIAGNDAAARAAAKAPVSDADTPVAK